MDSLCRARAVSWVGNWQLSATATTDGKHARTASTRSAKILQARQMQSFAMLPSLQLMVLIQQLSTWSTCSEQKAASDQAAQGLQNSEHCSQPSPELRPDPYLQVWHGKSGAPNMHFKSFSVSDSCPHNSRLTCARSLSPQRVSPATAAAAAAALCQLPHFEVSAHR